MQEWELKNNTSRQQHWWISHKHNDEQKNQQQKSTYCMIPFVQNIKAGETSLSIRSQDSLLLDGWVGGCGCKGLEYSAGYIRLFILWKFIEPCTYGMYIFPYACCASIKAFVYNVG